MSDDQKGVTETERYLSKLARSSFLSLWSYSNLFRKSGKELADLVVICGGKVIVFSDKNIAFKMSRDINSSWLRWYNRAIIHSVKQLTRAGGWIKNHPDRIFSDPACQVPAKIFRDELQDFDVHLVAVANGASKACVEYFDGGSGSLLVCPSEDPKEPAPFMVGNPGGENNFVHVFDEANLNVILQELDTITDFVDYLSARRSVFSEKTLAISPSEEDLLAMYLRNVDESGQHAFVDEDGKKFDQSTFFAVEEGLYLNFQKNPQYIRKRNANKVSYLWDNLIESFAGNYLKDSLISLPEAMSRFDGRDGGVELGLRYMALEPRIHRRSHAEAIRGAFEIISNSGDDRFFRAMMPLEDRGHGVAFFILLLRRHSIFNDCSHEEYRQARANIALAYSQNLLFRNKHLQRVVGIATEGEVGAGRSEDLIYQEMPEWNSELIEETKELSSRFGIFENASETKQSYLEYPSGPDDEIFRADVEPIPYFYKIPPDSGRRDETGNRAERRRRAAEARRRSRRPKR